MWERGIRSNNSIYLVISALTTLVISAHPSQWSTWAFPVLPDARSSRVSLPSPDSRAVSITFSHVPLWPPAPAPRSNSLAQMTGCLHGSSFWQNGCWEIFSNHTHSVSPRLTGGWCPRTVSGPCCSPRCVSHFERWGSCRRRVPSLPKAFVLFMKVLASFPQHKKLPEEEQHLPKTEEKLRKDDSLICLPLTYLIWGVLASPPRGPGEEVECFLPHLGASALRWPPALSQMFRRYIHSRKFRKPAVWGQFRQAGAEG